MHRCVAPAGRLASVSHLHARFAHTHRPRPGRIILRAPLSSQRNSYVRGTSIPAPDPIGPPAAPSLPTIIPSAHRAIRMYVWVDYAQQGWPSWQRRSGLVDSASPPEKCLGDPNSCPITIPKGHQICGHFWLIVRSFRNAHPKTGVEIGSRIVE